MLKKACRISVLLLLAILLTAFPGLTLPEQRSLAMAMEDDTPLSESGFSPFTDPDSGLADESAPEPTMGPTLDPEPDSLSEHGHDFEHAEAAPEPSPEPTPEPTPALRKRTELLALVNPWHEMEESYVPELQQVTWGYEEDQFMDVRAADALIQMISDCASAGNDPYVCSAYRSMEKQHYLFNNKLYRLIYEEGVAPSDAPEIAARSVAIPGTSEHQLGLAADIIDYYYPYLNSEQENRPTQKWLMEHCWDYGFILRYPNDKREITGIIYEPWHYRYVGIEAAKEIQELGLTLEEYLDQYYEPLG